MDGEEGLIERRALRSGVRSVMFASRARGIWIGYTGGILSTSEIINVTDCAGGSSGRLESSPIRSLYYVHLSYIY